MGARKNIEILILIIIDFPTGLNSHDNLVFWKLIFQWSKNIKDLLLTILGFDEQFQWNQNNAIEKLNEQFLLWTKFFHDFLRNFLFSGLVQLFRCFFYKFNLLFIVFLLFIPWIIRAVWIRFVDSFRDILWFRLLWFP